MNRKRFFYGICSLAAVCGCILLGCPKDGDSDKWAPVNSLDETKGTWKGSSSVTVPEIPLSGLLEGELAMLQLALNKVNPPKLPKSRLDYSVTTTIGAQDADFDITVNCKKYLEDAIKKNFVDIVWGSLETLYGNDFSETIIPDGVDDFEIDILDDYKIRVKGSNALSKEEVDFFDLEDPGFSLEINEKGNKLKLSVDLAEILKGDGLEDDDIGDMSVDLSQLAIKDLILYKQ